MAWQCWDHVERVTSIWNCRAHLSQQMLWQFFLLCLQMPHSWLCVVMSSVTAQGISSGGAGSCSVCSEHTKWCCLLSLGGMNGFLPEDLLDFTLGMLWLISCSCTSVSSPHLSPVSKDPVPVLTSGPRDKMGQLEITVTLNYVSDIKPERFTWVLRVLNRRTTKCFILNCRWWNSMLI